MRKVSITVLSLVMLMHGSMVFSAPKKANRKRNASVNVNANTTSVNTTDLITLEELEAKNAMEELERSIKKERDAEIESASGNLQEKINKVKNSCSGIKKDLDSIFGLNIATTVSSGLGTLASGGALVTGIMKAKTDKTIDELQAEIDKIKLVEERAKGLSDKPEELLEQLRIIMPELDADVSALESQIADETKKSKTLGNVRTGLMAGSIATSAASVGTSIASSVNAKKLAEKMKDCNTSVDELKVAKSQFTSDVSDVDDFDIEKNTVYIKASDILNACKGYDNDNIKQLQTMSTVSAVTSGIGTATSVAGTITSAFANSKKVREATGEDAAKKEKNLNLTSNIMAGITAGTSGTSTVLSAVSINKAKKDSDMAEKCEDALK